jgi:PadR family transcriptional regulator PadR
VRLVTVNVQLTRAAVPRLSVDAAVLHSRAMRPRSDIGTIWAMLKRTKALARVATALMEDPDSRHWGYQLSQLAGVRTGVLYPMLSGLLEEGWLRDGWEDPAEIKEKRPPRRYYELTEDGRRELGAIAKTAAIKAGRASGVKLGWI